VVAHSFGTYILGYTLLRFDFIRFNKVILCGSILPRDFPWDQLIARGQVQAVRNEFGVRDPWVKWVRWFVRGTGPSGAVGFTCQHPRLAQEEFDFDHGDYFGLDHMEDRWVPFLDRPLPEIPRAEAGPRIPRPKTALPWGLYAVMLALALLAGAVAADVASRRGTRTTAASPASATTAKLAPPAPAPAAAVLAGYVIDAETREPVPGVTLTVMDVDTPEGRPPTSVSDQTGRFRFDNLGASSDSPRQVRLVARKNGYEPSYTDPSLGATKLPIKLRPKARTKDDPP
jgi:Carboxypeptidase regulatory-like domain